jgi:replicative DNA helicase
MKKSRRDEIREALEAEANLGPTTSDPHMEAQIAAVAYRDHEAFLVARGLLASSDFTSRTIRLIWDAMAVVADRGGAVNSLTLEAQLRTNGAINEDGLTEELEKIKVCEDGSPGEIASYCRSIKEHTYRRSLAKVSSELHSLSKTPGESQELADKVAQITGGLGGILIPDKALQTLGEVVRDIGMEKFLDPLKDEEWIETEWPLLNELILGLFKKQMTLIAARPGVGKSTLASQIALWAAKHGKPTQYFSLEMDREGIFRRMVAAEAGVNYQDIIRGTTSPDERHRLTITTKIISELPLSVSNLFGRTVPEVKAAVREAKSKHGVVLVFLDHVQLMRGMGKGFRTRQEEMREISRDLKAMNLELDIALCPLAQLNREFTKRDDKAPVETDLAESGALEQDADTIIMIHRPDAKKSDGDKTKTKIYVRKQRYGPTGEFELRFEDRFCRFVSAVRPVDVKRVA